MQQKQATRNSLKTLKLRNRKVVLGFLRNSGAVSVNEISRAIGLSKMTVHKIIDYYLERNVVALVGKGVSTEEGGKKPNLFAFNPNHNYIYAVRLNEDFFLAGLLNLNGDTLTGMTRVDLGPAALDEAVAAVRGCFDRLVAEANLRPEECLAAVVGCNGIVDAEAGVALAGYEYPRWGRDIPLRDILAAAFPDTMQVHIDSWWRHLAYGEISRAEPGERDMFFFIGYFDERVAGGMVVDGKVYRGLTGFAGEIGHVLVNTACDDLCTCGGRGCLQIMVAPSRLRARARRERSDWSDSILFRPPAPEKQSEILPFILEAAGKGDALARDLLDEAAGYFAIAVNNIVHLCDPGLVVLSGDYVAAGEPFRELVQRKFDELTLKGINKHTRIVFSPLDQWGGAYGAANFAAGAFFDGEV